MKFDEVGYWSEVKLDIVREYASAYSSIMSGPKQHFLNHYYIDGFAGPGVCVSKATGNYLPGSPLNALLVEPPFKGFFLVDMSGDRVDHLRQVIGKRGDVRIFNGDCNAVLLNDVFPHIQYRDYRRALCLLDPYGLHLDWKVFETAGRMRTIDIFLNFPVMDMNRRVQWKNPDKAPPEYQTAMTRFWGDESWRTLGRKTVQSLFGEMVEEADTIDIALAFGRRLIDLAGFQHVTRPLAMRNSKGSTVYYLMLASQKQVAKNVVEDIFEKYECWSIRR